MRYKETLFFIGKCLTITHEQHNKILVENDLKSGNIDWDAVVKVSTAHYVFPALYCNLKRAHFLHYVPQELVEYMKHITDLNRDRNQQIMDQAKEINEVLLSNNITPIFLKGTGNLLEGLYEDIAERMVGDIDFLVSKYEFKKSIKILKTNGYKEKSYDFVDDTFLNRHYPKMTKTGKIGAVEIHYKMITNEKFFNYTSVKESLKKTVNNITLLSSENQILMTCYNKQFNDRGQWIKIISLRNSFDLYLQSKLSSVKKSIQTVNKKDKNVLNNFIASTNIVFNNPKSLEYSETKNTKKFIRKQFNFIEKPRNIMLWNLFYLYKSRVFFIVKSFFDKDHRDWLMKKITDKKWQKEKLVQLGFKKLKPNT